MDAGVRLNGPTLEGVTRHPFGRLRALTPRLELRVPGQADLDAIADAVARGVFVDGDPNRFPWYCDDPAERAASARAHLSRQLSRWAADDWVLPYAAVADDEVIGLQSLRAPTDGEQFTVETGSWLTLGRQGRGYGTEMRAAALRCAQALGARRARSKALTENAASIAVSLKVGYERDGFKFGSHRGELRVCERFVLDLDTWVPPVPVRLVQVDDTARETEAA